MLIDDAPYILLTVMVIVAALRLAHSLRARRHTKTINDAETALAAGIKPRRDYSTATCPICGKFDPSKPFISYAISCGRTDCLEP